jgi:hypothetical protein
MHRPFRLAFWRPGLLAAVLALVSQLALGAVVLPDDAPAGQLAELDAVSVLCTGAAPDADSPAPHRHYAADLTVCPLGIALAAPCCLPEPAPALPPRRKPSRPEPSSAPPAAARRLPPPASANREHLPSWPETRRAAFPAPDPSCLKDISSCDPSSLQPRSPARACWRRAC